MNNTEAIRDIRRRLRRIEVRLVMISRQTLIPAEFIVGSRSWLSPSERRVLAGGEDAVTDPASRQQQDV